MVYRTNTAHAEKVAKEIVEEDKPKITSIQPTPPHLIHSLHSMLILFL
jgi:hypothetical protein